ncbi:DeoR/GlpR family DNA-binding transcription regulator [Nocardioides pocheonensis]|jgi:DeoR family fructose operon transcriptional repressor|uniref:Lactose phosphotransferase system repressor n=1 Tax=Nocardioides pocheonensis TaxID=661485 RepID=A0A3N0GYD7_9ACTN|nr:DeoR/GlpR family DNA-binding transcription regulator [Nocardioides pocheonensis]RNM17483.1 DeoR/GlpR transcriptional regulator [Nocardioides pocheonensis]
MYAEERQAAIVTRARAEGRVEVASLADSLGVTTETVRRDLTALERAGVLRRVHGGAIPVERLGFEPAVDTREQVATSEKEAIAKAALNELPVDGAIALDAGTTTLRLAEAIPADRELTVVTNGLPIAMALAGRPNLTVHVVPGRVRSRTLAAVGEASVAFLRELYVDVAFLGTNGFSPERGFTTPDAEEAATKRALIGCAGRSVALADSSKHGVNHFAAFAGIEDIDLLITDGGLDPRKVSGLEAAGLQVVRA